MKILITGAAGSVGKQLTEKLASLDHSVLATDIKANPFNAQAGIEYQRLDITSLDFTSAVTKFAPDAIIHLASVLQIGKHMTRIRAYEIDVIATANLLRLAAELDIKKFVITTSGAAYGYYPKNNTGLIDESWPTEGNPDYFYSSHKSAVEGLMSEFALTQPGIQQVVFRPGAIIGPNFEGPVVNLFQQKMITGLLGYPGLFNFIWSEDVVDYLIEAVTSDITGCFNIAGDGALSLSDIAKQLNKVYLPLPAPLIKAVLSVLKPLGITQYGPEQVKFIKYRPVLSNAKLKSTFTHQPRYNSKQALVAYQNWLTENAQ